MKFIIKKDLILRSFTYVSKVLNSKSVLPVLSNFKLSLRREKLEILASNGETTIVDSIDTVDENDEKVFNYESTGECLINYRVLEIIRRMTGNEITFDCIDDSMIVVDDGNSSFKLNTIPSKEYPSISLELSADSLEVSAKDFSKSVSQVAFAVSTKDTSNVLTAVNLAVENNTLILSATDSARISRKRIPVDSDLRVKVNVPSKTLVDVARMCEGSDKIQIGFKEKKVYFRFGSTIVFSTLVSGNFPDLSNVLRVAHTINLDTNAKEMISALERVSLLFIDKQTAAKLKVSNVEFKITSKSQQFGSVVETINNYTFNDKNFEIILDCDFVIQAIRAIGQDDITFKFTGERKPLFIVSDKEPDLVQVIVPLRMVG